MNKTTFILSVSLFLTLHLTYSVDGKKDFLNRLSRQKRAWSYPEINVQEADGDAPLKKEKQIGVIKSDNPDANTYVLESGGGDKFEMRSKLSGGQIWQVKALDREVQSKYTLVAEALNSAGQPVESPVSIHINVLDLNDNPPEFDQTSLVANVDEDFKGVFMTLVATDADSDENDYNLVEFRYSGNEQPPATGLEPRFGVASNGAVTVIGNLDAELVPVVTFEVFAVDGAPGASLRHTATSTVTVTVNDANDHAPVFTNTEPYKVNVPESTPIQSVLITLYATDADKGINKAVTFHITNGNSDGKFSIKSYPNQNGQSKAEIALENMLDYESGVTQYTLYVEAYNADASNKDDPRFKTTTTVQINVDDVNEPPTFINTPYIPTVPENESPISDWFSVAARDLDFGETQTIKYSLVTQQSWFTIDENTGSISVVSDVDREDTRVKDGKFILKVAATDNGSPELTSDPVDITITILDKNDNAPYIKETLFNVCEDHNSQFVGNLTIVDKDSMENGPAFSINAPANWMAETVGAYRGELLTEIQQFDVNDPEHVLEILVTDNKGLAATSTVTVSVCRCETNGVCSDAVPVAAGFPVPVLVAIIAAILILLIIVLAVVAYRRRQKADLEKQALFIDDDDVRENLQAYHDEGGGEEDNDGYDISALQAPPLNKPRRVDEKPLGAQMPTRSRVPPDTDIGDYINDAKQQADNDPTAPPFDSLLVFDYEGQGSDAGSLSSLNSGTTDGSQDYQYLNNWGPRFKKLADMYGGGEDEE